MSNIYKPYTYLIGWSKHDKWYYGVRYAKGCHPNDLWIDYFTSSKRVSNLRHHFGEPDIIQIRKTFEDRISAILWEEKVLTKLDVLHSNRWINERINSNLKWTTSGLPPHNLIKETFTIKCEFCEKEKTLRKLKQNLNKKTCGSKSCVAKWTNKYNKPTQNKEFLKSMSKEEKSRKYGSRGFLGKSHSKATLQKIQDNLSRTYLITYPGGERIKVKNLKRFCEENNLNRDILRKYINKGPVPKPRYKLKGVTRNNTSGYSVEVI